MASCSAFSEFCTSCHVCKLKRRRSGSLQALTHLDGVWLENLKLRCCFSDPATVALAEGAAATKLKSATLKDVSSPATYANPMGMLVPHCTRAPFA